MTDNISLAEQMGVRPEDLDEHGVLKPYVAPEFAPYTPAPYPDTEQFPSSDPAPGDEPVSTPRIGWCPNGSVKGGICSPFNNVRPNWMGYYSGATANLRVDELILPGTHNSATDKQAPQTDSYDTCQDVSPHSQFQTGIRVLDLRVQFYFGYPQGDAKRFSIFHSTNSGRTVEGDCLQAAINLYTAHGNEVVILDFHEFRNFTDAAHRELATVIKNRLGSRLIEPKWKCLVLRQLWALQKNVVIAYNNSQRDPLFWPGVNQRWIGKNRPSSSELKTFVEQVGRESKPEFELRSIQAHKYTLVYQPDDMSSDVMSWFAAGEFNSPIMKFHIINTDWSLRCRHIDNCIHANSFRNQERTSAHVTPNNLTNGFIPNGIGAIVLVTANGNWSASMTLPTRTINKATLLIICKAQLQTTLHVPNSDFPIAELILKQNDVIFFQYSTAELKWILQPDHVYSPNTSGDSIPVVRSDEKFIKYQTADYNWTDNITLPTSAPIYSYVEIASNITATEGWHSHIHRRPDQRVYRLQRGDKYVFMLNNQVTWQAVKTPIHSYGAAQAGPQMEDTGTEQTRVHFKNADWVREITLPLTAWEGDEVTLTSDATLTATVMGTNLSPGTSIQLRTGDTLKFRYTANTRKWRRI